MGERVDKDLQAGEKKAGVALPALYAPDPKTAERVLEFFAAKIRNKNTRGELTPWPHLRPGKSIR